MLSGKKNRLGWIFDLLVNPIKRTGVNANQLTVLSLFFALLYLYLIYTRNYPLALFSIIIAITLDALDGHLARATRTASKYGAYLDTIVDRYVEFIILFSLLLVNLPTIILPAEMWISLSIFGSLMTTYAKAAYSEKTGKGLSGGLLERAERVVILIIAVGLLNLDKTYSLYILILLAALTNLSAIDRIIRALILCTRN